MNRKVNTMLCIDVKTLLLSDPILLPGKTYRGVLVRDGEEHLRFEETLWTAGAVKRNPHVYDGRYITVTRRDDGTYRLNFKPVRMDPGTGFTVGGYARDVASEIAGALGGLVEK